MTEELPDSKVQPPHAALHPLCMQVIEAAGLRKVPELVESITGLAGTAVPPVERPQVMQG